MAYVYRHVRLDKNEPFYIGIGNNEYRAYSTKNRNRHWKSIASKTEYRVDILFEDIDYEHAKEKEVEFIALYGRSDLMKGTLCNKTDGGDGCLGLVHSKEAREKMGAPNRGKVISKEHREAISKFHKGKKHTKEWKRMMSKRMSGENSPMYGSKISEWHKQRISESSRGSNNKISKLTEDDVLEIRSLYSKGGESHRSLARKYGVVKGNITSILNRKTWNHI